MPLLLLAATLVLFPFLLHSFVVLPLLHLLLLFLLLLTLVLFLLPSFEFRCEVSENEDTEFT